MVKSRSKGRGRRRQYVRRSRRLASQGMKTRSGKTYPRRAGALATAYSMAGAAARGVDWLRKSELGKRVASAAAGYGAARLAKRVKETDNGAGASAQYSKNSFKYGKRKSTGALVNVLNKVNACARYLRFGATNRFTDVGAFNHYFSGAPDIGSYAPISVVDLTGTDQVTGSTGITAVNVSAMRQMYVNASGAVTFLTTQGRKADGATSTAYFEPVKAEGARLTTFSSSFQAPKNGILKYVNAKFLFKCPKARPGWIKISLVRFADEGVVPGLSGDEHDGFWQRRLKALIYNPISHETTARNTYKESKGMIVYKTWVRRWNPDTSTNLASYMGEQIRVDLFLNLNRYVNQSEHGGQKQTTLAGLDDDKFIEEGKPGSTGEESNLRVWNTEGDSQKRLFLLIENTNFDAPATSYDGNNHLTFDMEIRNKIVYVGGRDGSA